MKRNDIIFLLASSVILTIAWVFFSVLHASLTSTISKDLGQAIKPISPTFDQKIITQLQARQKTNPIYTNLPQETPTPPPASTQSAVPISTLSLPVITQVPVTLTPTPSPTGGSSL
jgi:hypothetical protein